jgi:hypothetical protein
MVNENRPMNIQQKQFVTSLVTLGVLAMIVSDLAFAEKIREDGHLPERDGQGSGTIISPVADTGTAGILMPVFRMPGSGAGQRSGQPVLPLSGGMR